MSKRKGTPLVKRTVIRPYEARHSERGKTKVNNLETLMAERARSSVALKQTLYQRDDFASTTGEGKDALSTSVHTCLVCKRAAAGKDAQVRHKFPAYFPPPAPGRPV